jgi:ABC-type nitrate/sulfonate/bicarbonate transport system substrate-binding protein
MDGSADIATNAETQLLRQSVDDPNLRVIFTVAESFYRIVARKSAGIAKVSDLKGKRITTPRNTSAHYFLVRMLATANLTEADVTIVPITPVTDMSVALKDRRVDAIAMWEPESERAIAAIGDDAIVLQDRNVYRELFNLNTSTKILADPAKRRAVVEFVKALITSSERIRARPVLRAVYLLEAELSAGTCFEILAGAALCGRDGERPSMSWNAKKSGSPGNAIVAENTRATRHADRCLLLLDAVPHR